MDIFAEHCDSLEIPLFHADWFGHGESNRPFWIGGHATLKGKQLLISQNNK
jgi:muramoyltetrapeptide carboxypeptidase